MERTSAAVTGGSSSAAVAPAGPFDARHACGLLLADPDRGLRYTVRGLADAAPVHEDPAWPELLRLLGRNPFVAALRARAHGYAGDPPVTEVALAGQTDPAGAWSRRDWLLEYSTVCRALRSRTLRLAETIDAAAGQAPRAPIAGIAAGYAPELRFSAALRGARAHVTLVEPDPRASIAAARLSESLPVTTRRATLADVIAGAVRISGSSLIYVPTLAEHLPLDSILDLLGVLATWLRPGGTVVMPFYTALPEAGFLRWIGEWRPNVMAAAELKRRAGDTEGVAAQIEHDSVPGLAYLRLERLTHAARAHATTA